MRVLDIKTVATLAEDVQILIGLSEKLLDELATMEAAVDAALIELRMS